MAYIIINSPFNLNMEYNVKFISHSQLWPLFFTTAFYHFVSLNNVKSIQTIIQDYCDKKSIKGTILLANEGINGTISGEEKNILEFHEFLKYNPIFSKVFEGIEYKSLGQHKNPFYRMKVRLKKEIVTIRYSRINPKKEASKSDEKNT